MDSLLKDCKRKFSKLTGIIINLEIDFFVTDFSAGILQPRGNDQIGKI